MEIKKRLCFNFLYLNHKYFIYIQKVWQMKVQFPNYPKVSFLKNHIIITLFKVYYNKESDLIYKENILGYRVSE